MEEDLHLRGAEKAFRIVSFLKDLLQEEAQESAARFWLKQTISSFGDF